MFYALLLVMDLNSGFMKKIMWLWKKFWGKRYKIVYTEKLRENEVLFYGHKIFIGKENPDE